MAEEFKVPKELTIDERWNSYKDTAEGEREDVVAKIRNGFYAGVTSVVAILKVAAEKLSDEQGEAVATEIEKQIDDWKEEIERTA